MWIFDRLTCRMEGEKYIYSSPLSNQRSKGKFVLYKRLECEFLYCYKLMLRLHRVVLCKVKLGLS